MQEQLIYIRLSDLADKADWMDSRMQGRWAGGEGWGSQARGQEAYLPDLADVGVGGVTPDGGLEQLASLLGVALPQLQHAPGLPDVHHLGVHISRQPEQPASLLHVPLLPLKDTPRLHINGATQGTPAFDSKSRLLKSTGRHQLPDCDKLIGQL